MTARCKPHRDSLTPKILELNAAGVSNIDIARRLLCSRANIRQTLKLHKRATVFKRPLFEGNIPQGGGEGDCDFGATPGRIALDNE